MHYTAVRSTVLVNMAEVYVQLKDWKLADQYIQEGITLCKETENLNGLAVALQRQADIFLASKRTAGAEKALKELLDVRKQLGEPSVWVDDNLSLINFYIETNQVDKAIEFCQRNLHQGSLTGVDAKNYGVLTNSINIRLQYYQQLARCYKIKGDQNRYSEMLENIVVAKDSFYEANSANAIAELQTKYDVQKKENTIIQQRFDLLKKDFLFYAALLLFVFLTVLGIVLFRNYRRKQSMRMEFMQEEEKRKSREAVKDAEEKERKRISRDLHDNLGAYAASLGSNIERLSRNSFQSNHMDVAALQELKNNCAHEPGHCPESFAIA